MGNVVRRYFLFNPKPSKGTKCDINPCFFEFFYLSAILNQPNLRQNVQVIRQKHWKSRERSGTIQQNGIDVDFKRDGATVHDKVWLVDFGNPANNDWLAVNQFTVNREKGEVRSRKLENDFSLHTSDFSLQTSNRRLDVILFVNGLQLVVIELKNSADENATTRKAFDQLQTYKLQLVIITDRNDLDDQLHGTFAACQDLLGQKPSQAENRDEVKELLQVASGGVVFTTLQKFAPDPGTTYPELSNRRNIVVMADEAHRSQYGHYAKAKQTGEISYGFSKHLRDALPNASYLGFTGTPIELGDKNTKAVSGDYIDVYDISRAVEDGATVRIFYEGRLAKLELSSEERPKIDDEFEEITEGEEDSAKEKLKTKWAALEALVGSEKRIKLIAKDLVEHWEQRLASMDGKAMIVCMSRRICVELFKAIAELRPEWVGGSASTTSPTRERVNLATDPNPTHERGISTKNADRQDAYPTLAAEPSSEYESRSQIEIVMTGSASDPIDWQPHIHPKRVREQLAKRFKDPKDPLKLVIVRDMRLTGFDAPCMHTMYVDKPMGGHNLMQAIARVNRVFHGKPGGLVVDYLGLAAELKKALAQYTQSDQDSRRGRILPMLEGAVW